MGVTASRTGEYAAVQDPHIDHLQPHHSSSLHDLDRKGSSLAHITTTEFVWNFGGHSVYVTGAWDDWRLKVALSKTSQQQFTAVLALPVGTFQYKFIVDGNWKHNPALPTERDQHGNLNNIVTVKPQTPEYDSNQTPHHDLASSPVESYDFSILPEEVQTTEPPMLPRLLASVPLDHLAETHCNGTDFVRINHMFVTNCDPAYGSTELRTIASEMRYKSKVVTTILITPKNKLHSMGITYPRSQPIPIQRPDPRSVQNMGETQTLIMDALNNV